MNKQMKIAVFCPQLIPTHPAGSQMIRILRGLKNEFEFTIFSHNISQRMDLEGIKFYKIPILIHRPLMLMYLMDYVKYLQIFKIIKNNFEIIHAIETCTPFANLVTYHFCSAKFLDLIKNDFVKYQGIQMPYRKLMYSFGKEMEHHLANNIYLKSIIAVSQGLKKEINTYYNPLVSIEVISNSVDIDRFVDAKKFRNKTRKNYNIKDKEILGIICALGDWQRKGLDILIESISLIKNSNVKIIVIGKGPIEFYKNKCIEFGVIDQFIFVGFTSEVEKYYGAADFFIFPSIYEALPLVVLEAAASGLPIISTPVNGVTEFLTDGKNGIFIERDPKSIADAIRLIIEDRKFLFKMGENSLKISHKFNANKMIDNYRAIYQKIAK